MQLPKNYGQPHAFVNSPRLEIIVAKAAARTRTSAPRPSSKEDVKTLKGMARKEPASKIAKSLKRTEGATRQKATALGVSLNTAEERASPRSVHSGAKAPADPLPAAPPSNQNRRM